MARGRPATLGLALALVCVINQAQTDESCRTGCRGASQTFKYQDGTTYKYNFDSKIEVSLSSAEGQKSITEIKATVLLTQQPQCNQLLRLQNVQVITSDGKKHAQIPDVDKPIRINYHDGHLEDSICVTPGDSQNSLNLKRAIASVLQANLHGSHETDVFGLCPTEVSQQKEGNNLVIQKVRNLNRCAYRENIKQDFFATTFNLNSEIKSSPLLNADYNAKLRIKSGILDQATVEEQYLYLPFSVGKNGAKASVETTLKYVGTVKDAPTSKVSQPRSIIFEDPHPVNAPTANVNSILTAVKQAAKTIDVTVGQQTAKEFANLVKILRVSKKDDLLAVYNQVRAGVGFADKVGAKKLFLDALLIAGNGDNVEVAVELLKNKELGPLEQELVYLGLSVVRHPTEGSLNAAVALLNQPNLPRSAYLGVGNLAGAFCRQHSCGNVGAVDKLTQKLAQELGSGKAGNRQEENDIIYVLKALANVGRLSDGILGKITAIAQDKKAPNRLRVTALETYLADACADKLRDSALGILKDIQQDSEVRIKAYLVIAQCPNSKAANAIKALLENEPSYQVGGFIVSNIRNIRASTNPDKELAKQHLGLINVNKRFPIDPRKYSWNSELSYNVGTLGLANSIESNVIYSQNSFLPRSSSLNLTAEVLGHTFNFLQLDVRQENLDRLLEHYFGPRGLLRANSLQELWDTKGKRAKELAENLRSKIVQSLRARRDVSKAEIDQIGKQVQIKTNELNNDLDLDYSVKAFGSEILFVNVNDDVRKWTPEAIIDKIVNGLNTGLDRVKSFEETLRSNLLFLDAEVAYPTSSGFPLRLGVEGTSNIQVKASGAVDVRALLRQDTTLKISLIPSANVEVSARLTVDTQVVESGLKVVSTLYTATGGDLIVQVTPKSLDVKFALPLEKQDLVSATHDIVFHTRESGASEVNSAIKFAQNKDFSICLDQLSSFIGLTFCGDFTGPNRQGEKVPLLPFPLSGDAKVSVTIEREDLSQYHYRRVLYDDRNKIGGEVTLEAIAKNGKKKVSLEVEAFLRPETVFKAKLTSPVASASVEGRVTSNDNEKSVSLRLIHDTNEYFGKAGVSIEGTSSKAVYKPILQYKTPQNSGLQVPPYKVEGQLIVENKGPLTSTYTFDNIRIVIPDQKTISVNGKLGTDPDTVFADLTASDGSNKASFSGKLQLTRDFVRYNAELKNSLNPQANVHLKGELTRSAEGYKNFFQVAHGGDFSNKNNILTLENSIKRKYVSPRDYLLDTENKLSYPGLGIGVEVGLEAKPNSLEYEVDVQYNNVKWGSELEWEHNDKRDGTDFKLEFGVWGLSNRLTLKSKRQVADEISQIDNSLEVNGKRFEVKGKVKHRIRPQDIDAGADLAVTIPSHNNPIQIVGVLKANPSDLDISEKITSGSTVYVDAFLKANKAGNANGSIKVNLKGQLVINGQIKANKGSGTGDITIELPAVGRTSKIDSTFTVHEPKYNVIVNIYPLFNKDKSKKITLSTQNTVTQQSIDSKNSLDVFDNKLEANVKGSRQGDFENGKFSLDADVTLPNNHYLAAKLNREVKGVNHVLDGNALAILEYRNNKNQPGDKITLKTQVKQTNLKERVYDLAYQLTAERANGPNLNVDWTLKRLPKGDWVDEQATAKIYGSVLPSPIELSATHNSKHTAGTTGFKSSYAPLGTLSTTLKHDITGGANPLKADLIIELTSPSKIVKTAKVEIGGSLLKTDVVDVKLEGKVYADEPNGVIVDFTSTGEVRANDKEGRVKGTVRSGQLDPLSIDAGFSRSEIKGDKQVQGDVAVQYGKNQNIKGDVTLVRLPQHEYKLDLRLDTPSDKLRNNRLQVHTKRNDENTHLQSETIFTTNGKTWTGNLDLLLSDIAPSIDVKVKDPEGKLSQIFAKTNKLSDRQFGAELKLIDQKANFLLEGSVDANVESVDDFHVKAAINSPNFKLDKVTLDAQNKPAKTGRRIQVTAKSGNKNVLAGSTSYTAREEQGKLIVEGSGSFKVHEETKSANFKYIRQKLTQDKNGESGIEISFDAGLGNRAIDAELKVTNKQFRISDSYCEEKKQCAHVEIDVKTTVEDLAGFNQEIEIAIDLRKLGLSHEFGLKAVTNRKGYVLDHTVDVHFQNQENSKYQYSLYLHTDKAGVSLTTPKRIVALEADVNVPPTLLKSGGKISGDLLLYLDKKNQPDKKTGITAYLNIDPSGQSVSGEIRSITPGLKRPSVISINSKISSGNGVSATTDIIADIFAQPDQKLVINVQQNWPDRKNLKLVDTKQVVQIKSSGLNIDIRYEDYLYISREGNIYKAGRKIKYNVGSTRTDSAIIYEFTPRSLQALVQLFNHEIYKVNAQLQLSEKQQIVDSEITISGRKPLVSHLEIKNLNTLKYTLAHKDTPNDKLQINSGLIPGQIADFRAEIIKSGATHELGHATVKLDDANFLKSDYNVQSKNIENLLLKPIKEGINQQVDGWRKISEDVTKNLGEQAKQLGETAAKALPDVTPIRQYFTTELNQIKEEIVADKTIRDLGEFLNNVLAAIGQGYGETITHISELIESIVRSLQTSFAKVNEITQKELIPKLKVIVGKVSQLVAEIVDTASEVVLTVGAKLAAIAEQYRPELQQLVTVLGELSQDVFKATLRVYEAIKNVFVDQWHQIYNELKSLPAIEQLKVEYQRLIKQGLPGPEVISNTIRDVVSTLKDIAPTEELKAVVQAIGDYVTLKLTNKPVDDVAAIDKILKAVVAAVRKLLGSLTAADAAADFQISQLPLPVIFLSKLPRLVAVRFSVLSYLLREDIPVPTQFLASLVNKPRNLVAPFPLYGLVAQGQHIFTFDGKHLTFPGQCNYLLARDAVDGNFTVVGSYTKGLLTAISLTQGSDTITLKKQGQVTLNNAATELPVRKPNIAAFRDTERIQLVSSYGIKVICGPELVVCGITASGFYHGKLRGLLGNGNNEPYDDFTLPNGKIVTAESEFGNGYKLTSSCAPVQTVSHHGHHPAPTCDKLFGWESSLRYCYAFVDVENFKLACEHGVAAGVKDTEQAIAVAYVAACNQHGIPLRVPSQYVQCTNGEKPVDVGEVFSVKTPGKAADIVILVETIPQNEQIYKEYIQPLVQQLNTELHSKGVSDVEFHLIAYGGENQWPSHITSAGGKLTFKSKAPNLKFTESPVEDRLVTGCPHVDGLLEVLRKTGHDIKLALGLNLQARTYNEGLQYPFRANAIKTIIAVAGKPCEVGRLYPLQLLRTLLYRSNSINLNLITPVNRDGAKAEAKNIVGFNTRNVFAVAQTKSKLKNFADLGKEFTYNDYCIDFTLQNDGNVFISDNILLQAKAARKQFVQTASHGIVEQLVGTEKGYDCKCKYVTPYTATNVCRAVFSKEKPQAKKAGNKS